MDVDVTTSLEVHLKGAPGRVHTVEAIEDVGCGMYPIYYVERESEILVGTSVTDLIFELGCFQENEAFDPPKYLEEAAIGDGLQSLLPASLLELVPNSVASIMRDVGFLSSTHWNESSETADNRVKALQPFEYVTPNGSSREFEPTFSVSDPEEFVDRSAAYIQEFVNEVERQFPNHEHIIRMGGKDSQLIALVPKITDNWSVFSAEPNHPVVKRFLEKNNININELYYHDNQNEESFEEFRRKVICSDLRSDPRHLRWYPTLEEIVTSHDGDVIFWGGTEGDTIYSYHVDYGNASGEEYFDLHFSRAANWQSITHQATKNYTGVPMLSPYHSPAIWKELYRHYDPQMISEGDDLRPALGERLFDNDVWWPERNPGPSPYIYDWKVSLRSLYLEYIHETL